MTIILIGPMCAGKSTIAALLAQELNMPRCEIDEVRWGYYAEIGFSDDDAKRIIDAEGTVGLLRYMKPYEAHAVERVLQDFPDHVIDFGAGHSVYEDEDLFARVQQALAPYSHVILVLPSPDLDESIAILNARLERLLMDEIGVVEPEILALNKHFVKHPSNGTLATLTVYTENKTPDDSAREIIRWLENPD